MESKTIALTETNPIERLIVIAWKDREVAELLAALPDSKFKEPVFKHVIEQHLSDLPADKYKITEKSFKERSDRLAHTPAEAAAWRYQYGTLKMNHRNATVAEAPALFETLRLLESQSLRSAAAKALQQDKPLPEIIDMLSNSFQAPKPEELNTQCSYTLPECPRLLQQIASAIATELAETIAARHILAAAVIIGAVAGKHVGFRNRGAKYYCNLALVILGDTGSNKSGFYQVVKRMIAGVVNYDCPAASTLEGFMDTYCDTVPPDKKRQKADTQNLIKQAEAKQLLDRHGSLVILDEFRAFLETMVPKSDSVRNGQILCRLVETESVKMTTATGGIRVLADTCFTFLGFSQIDPWNDEVRNAGYQTGGLAGRIIPVNPKQFVLNGLPTEPVTIELGTASLMLIKQLFHPIDTPTDYSERSFEVYFGEDDALGALKASFGNTPIGQLASETPDMWETLQSKVLIQAAKLATIFAIAEMAEASTPTPRINAAKYLAHCFQIIAGCHVGNSWHEVLNTEQRELMNKIENTLRRKGGCTKRDLLQNHNLKGWELDQLIKAMLEADVINTTKQGKKTIFRLTVGAIAEKRRNCMWGKHLG